SFAGNLEFRNCCIQRKLKARLAPAQYGSSFTHSPRRLPAAQESVNVLPMNGSKTLGNQEIQWRSDRLRFRVTKDFLGALIEQRDVLVFINGDYCVGRNGEDPGRPCLAEPKLLFQALLPGDVDERRPAAATVFGSERDGLQANH